MNKDNGVDKELIVTKAVDLAVEEMPKEYLLKPFLDAHRPRFLSPSPARSVVKYL